MEENNFQKPKKGMSLICFIAIGVVLCVLVFAGINSVTGAKKAEEAIEGGSLSSLEGTEDIAEEKSNSKNSKYDGSKAYGTEVEFVVPEYTKLPEKVNDVEKWYEDGEDTWYYDLDAEGNAINVHGYFYSFTGDVVIPDTIDGHKIISLGDDLVMSGTSFFEKSINSDYYWHTITSITIPDGVKYINDATFYALDNLESVTLPESVVYLGRNAFAYCGKLSKINSQTVGEYVLPENIEYIEREAFQSCDALSTIEIPKNIKFINKYLFDGCDNLKEITLPDHVEHICDGAFSTSGLEKITVGKNLKTIGWVAFFETKIKEIELPDSVESIERQAFYFTPLNKFVYNGKLKYIGEDVFGYTEVENPIRDSQLPK